MHEYIVGILCTIYIAYIYAMCYILYGKAGGSMGDKYTEAQKKATIKYLKEKTDSIQIRAPKGTKEAWKTAAEEQKLSLNQFIVQTMDKTIENTKKSNKKY